MEKTNTTEIITIEASGQLITAETVKKYLVSGGGAVTDQEIYMFLALCKAQGLNPLVKDAYLIKYGNSPATTVVGKDAITKRAAANVNYDGAECGIILQGPKGEIIERQGTIIGHNEMLIGGWARIYVKNRKVPSYSSASLAEYNTGKSLWASKPATMIRKVALVQAMREAFPEDLQQLYDAAEIPFEPRVVYEDKGDVIIIGAPESPAPHSCADCGQAIEPNGKRTSHDVAQVRIERYGRALCNACAKRVAEAVSQPAYDQTL